MSKPAPLPPHSPESEMALLGSMLLDPKIIPDVRAAVGSGSAMYSEAHAAVFDSILATYAKNASIDLVQVIAGMNGQLSGLGGPDYLLQLAESVPSAVNWPHYAREVREKALLRKVIDLCADTLHRARDDGEPREIVTRALQDFTALAETMIDANEVKAFDAMAELLEGIRARTKRYIPTGVRGFDRAFGGIPANGLTTILGVPGSGKSSLAFRIADHAAVELSIPVRVFSYEMSAVTACCNVLSARSGVELSYLIRHNVVPTETDERRIGEAHERYRAADFAFVQRSVPADEIYARCAVYRRKGVRLVVVDYVQHLPGSGNPRESDYERISAACRILQRISRDLDMAVVMVSQITLSEVRQARAPRASDGKGSGAIQDASDMMIGVYRECVFSGRGEEESDEMWDARRRAAVLGVVKNKQGPCGDVQVTFEPEIMRFVDVEECAEPPAPLPRFDEGLPMGEGGCDVPF